MKVRSVIVASAWAFATFFVGAIALGWETNCSTSYSGGTWTNCHSENVQATATGTAYLYVTAPYTSATNCGTRSAKAFQFGEVFIDAATCPGPGIEGTPECCVKESWNATDDVWYYVKAEQGVSGASTCGPTNGKISSTNYNCDSESP